MQADKIVKKILDDATVKSSEILTEAQNNASKILKEAEDFSKLKEKETLKKVEEFKKKTEEKYSTLLKIEKSKLKLNYKQKVLNDLKDSAINFFASLNKNDTIELIEKLIDKYAEPNEKMFICLDTVNKEDLSKLEKVKKLSLQVEETNLNENGIILVGKNCDKNLLFSTLVNNAYEKWESEINKILF